MEEPKNNLEEKDVQAVQIQEDVNQQHLVIKYDNGDEYFGDVNQGIREGFGILKNSE